MLESDGVFISIAMTFSSVAARVSNMLQGCGLWSPYLAGELSQLIQGKLQPLPSGAAPPCPPLFLPSGCVRVAGI